jgi:hypothetical protein
VRGGEGHVHVAAFADGLAAVHAFDHGELAGLLLQQPRDAVDVLGAFGRGHLAPHCVVGLACGLHGGVHIGLVGLGDACELLLVGGVDGVEVLAALGLHPLAVDEELVLGVDLDVVGGLGCGGEGPVEGVLLGGHGFKDRPAMLLRELLHAVPCRRERGGHIRAVHGLRFERKHASSHPPHHCFLQRISGNAVILGQDQPTLLRGELQPLHILNSFVEMVGMKDDLLPYIT